MSAWQLKHFRYIEPAAVTKTPKQPTRGRTLTPDEQQTCRDKAADGWSNDEIAAYFGVSRSQVGALCRGIERRRVRHSCRKIVLSAALCRRAVAANEAGISWDAIARRLKVSPDTVRRNVREQCGA